MKPVWIVDDDRSIRWVLEKALAREGIAYKTFASAHEALQALAVSQPQVLVSDIRMPGESGLELLGKVKERHPHIPVIIMTAYSDLDSAVAAFQGGAFEYLPKPFDVDHAVALIRRAIAETPARAPADAPASPRRPRCSARRRRCRRCSARSAGCRSRTRRCSSPANRAPARSWSRARCTGTARAPRGRSSRSTPRRSRRTCWNRSCSGTSAARSPARRASRRGRFEQAEGGTLFLDEIGDMPPDLQVRLLRVLSDGEYYRVGGHAPLKANVRIIAATHQDLEERVRQGLFREDLMHRLNVVRLRLPPLRERREDIALLARHFLQKSARELAVEPKRLTDAALKVLCAFEFPGNVRQLENICHWLTVMAPGQRIDAADLPPEVREPAAAAAGEPDGEARLAAGARSRARAGARARRARASADRLEKEFERTLILRALAHTGGHRMEAAQWLGWGRNTLTRKIQELGLEPELKKGAGG